MARTTIDYFIFDSDGTLVDTLQLIVASFNYAVKPMLGKSFDQEHVAALFGPTMPKILASTLPATHVAEAVERYHQYFIRHFREYAKPYPGIPKLLSALQEAGRTLGVLTGAGKVPAEATMQESHLSRFFTTLVTGDDVEHPKPDPEGLRLAISRIKAVPERTIYIGDSKVDIEASRRAGIRSGAALWGSRYPAELSRSTPGFLFQDPSQVMTILGN